MANLKEIRIRLASVQSTQKITGAMKMVSAAKLRKAQTAIQRLRPYSRKMTEILGNLATDASDDNPLSVNRGNEKVVLIAIASNKGLCGGFNSAVLKKIQHLLTNDYAEQVAKGTLQMITIGKRVSEFVQNKKIPALANYDALLESVSFEKTAQIAEELMQKFIAKEIDTVQIIYNEFKNAATQTLTVEQFLPIVPMTDKQQTVTATDYIYEPDKATLFAELLPKAMKLRLFKCLLDSLASEHGARMTAMHKATENANELTKQLNLTYNKLRQSAITNEIIEIVSGAEALG
ncbi:MAG: ATP synthase F1 subunit gamma [Bacteroidales bacterium]|jgi:F-type H+-transporting ATPase subunit gamma|nr:ATP synthase F1 subunit gamma [Bacteroidales bacterium]